MAMLDLEGILSDVLGNMSAEDMLRILQNGGLRELLGQVISAIMAVAAPMFLLCSIPALIYGIALCFFGVRIYRVLLVIQSVIIGGCTGSFLTIFIYTLCRTAGGNYPKAGGIIGWGIFGFLLIGALCGLAAWFLYMVFLFLQSFGIGFSIGFGGFIMIRMVAILEKIMTAVANGGQGAAGIPGMIVTSCGVGIGIGVLLGLVLGVLTCIFAKWLVMGTTAFKGGQKVGTTLALLVFVAHGTYGVYQIVSIVLSILLIGGGFAVQFLMDKKNPCNIGRKSTNGGVDMQQGQYRQPGQYGSQGYGQQPQYAQQMQAQPQMIQQPVEPKKCKLIGLDGMYKGFDFDIDRNTALGRDTNRCNIIFPDSCAGVSKVQCELKLNPETGAVSIEDKFSTYGTSVNGVKLEKGAVRFLNPGDVIMFGENNVFKIEY